MEREDHSPQAESAVLLPMSLVVMTYNEAANIARCLDSVPFVSEKLVVDCGSMDDTVEIARAHGARVVEQAWLGFGPQRNFASEQATYDWILVLDADEFLSHLLREECLRRLPELLLDEGRGKPLAAIWLRRSTWYMGAPMRWYRPMVGSTWPVCIIVAAPFGLKCVSMNRCVLMVAVLSLLLRSIICTIRRWCTSS